VTATAAITCIAKSANRQDEGQGKAKGVGELGICGVGAVVANAIYNAAAVRVRDYPITPDKLIDRLPGVA
jgi:CO/xanthine dehydrogenase Mo-binding subunit